MQVKKGELSIYVDFLHEMKLKGKASIGRSKLIDVFEKPLKEYSKDQITIIDEYDGWKDKEEGIYDNANKELKQTMNTLMNDETEIKFNSPFKKDLAEALENYDEELSGVNAEIYANLYEDLIKENE